MRKAVFCNSNFLHFKSCLSKSLTIDKSATLKVHGKIRKCRRKMISFYLCHFIPKIRQVMTLNDKFSGEKEKKTVLMCVCVYKLACKCTKY